MVHASPPTDAAAAAAVVGPIGEGTGPVELPQAVVYTPFASATATRVVMTFTFIVLAALAVLALVGPHIPAGE